MASSWRCRLLKLCYIWGRPCVPLYQPWNKSHANVPVASWRSNPDVPSTTLPFPMARALICPAISSICYPRESHPTAACSTLQQVQNNKRSLGNCIVHGTKLSYINGPVHDCINTLRPRQNSRHFPDDIFKCIFLNENVWISIKISPKFVS